MDKSDKLKVALLVATLAAPSVHKSSAQNMSSRDTLRTEIKTDIHKANLIRENPHAILDAKGLLLQKFEQPVTTPLISLNETRIGPFTGSDVTSENNYTPYKSNTQNNKPKIIREERPLGYDRTNEKYEDLAYCIGDTIQIPKWKIAPKFRKAIEQVEGNQAQYILGNPVAQMAVYNHEKLHSDHFHRKHLHKNSQYLPVDHRFITDYATEKLAFCTEYLTVANIWRFCKEKGLDTLQINNEIVSTDSLADMYPGLGDELRKNGFNPESKESLKNIAKISAKQWDKIAFESYSESQFMETVSEEKGSLMGKIQAARDLEHIQKDMLKNIDIGYGVTVDLPEEMLPLFMPNQNIVQNFVYDTEDLSIFLKDINKDKNDDIPDEKKSLFASSEGLLKIDKYLDDIGFKNDKEKSEYLKVQFEKIVSRKPDADQKLCSLMLDCQYSRTTEPMIVYSDKLKFKHYKNHSRVFNSSNTLSVSISPLEERLENRRNYEKQKVASKTFDATQIFSKSR